MLDEELKKAQDERDEVQRLLDDVDAKLQAITEMQDREKGAIEWKILPGEY